MIRMKELDALQRSIGCRIVNATLEENHSPDLYRRVLLHFENGANLEIYLSSGMMRVTASLEIPYPQPF